MIRLNIYKKNSIDMNLLIGTKEKDLWNMPMYNEDIILHKGVTETIEFSVRNHDRKAETLPTGAYLKFVAINQKLQQKIEKTMDVVNASLGRYSVTLTKTELNNYDDGDFIGHVSEVFSDGTEELLYTGVDWYPYFNVCIKQNDMELFEEATVLDSTDFIKDTYTDDSDGITYERFVSSMITSDITSSQTFNIKVKDFIGTVKVQGSNMENPEHNEDDWFIINTKEYTESTSETFTVNATLNCLYVRVEYLRKLGDTSTIEEVTYRN